MAAGRDDGGTSCAGSLSEPLGTQGGKADGRRHHKSTGIGGSCCRPRVGSACPEVRGRGDRGVLPDLRGRRQAHSTSCRSYCTVCARTSSAGHSPGATAPCPGQRPGPGQRRTGSSPPGTGPRSGPGDHSTPGTPPARRAACPACARSRPASAGAGASCPADHRRWAASKSSRCCARSAVPPGPAAARAPRSAPPARRSSRSYPPAAPAATRSPPAARPPSRAAQRHPRAHRTYRAHGDSGFRHCQAHIRGSEPQVGYSQDGAHTYGESRLAQNIHGDHSCRGVRPGTPPACEGRGCCPGTGEGVR